MRNENQTLAVEHYLGPCLTIAPPGSGKTKCLVERVLFLIKNKQVPPDKILVLTFTKEAACEMKERFCRECSSCEKLPFFGTFHSLFYFILKEEIGLSSGQIINSNVAVSILKEAFFQLNISVKGRNLYDLIKEFSKCINKGILVSFPYGNISAETVEEIFQLYQKLKAERNYFEFDDLMIQTKKLFIEQPFICEKWQNRFSFVLLDEVQDINPLQFDIVKMLAAPHENLFAVGDDDQSIYGFRGSDPNIMLSFESKFQNVRLINLDKNYRSARQIVSVANHLISHNSQRFEKNCKAFEKGFGVVSYHCFSDEWEEGEYIIRNIKSLAVSRSVGILFRNKSDALFLSKQLEANHIYYYSKEPFLNHIPKEIICDFIAYFKLGFKMGDETCERTLYQKPKGDLSVLSKLSYFAGVNYIRKGIGYDNYLFETYGKEPTLYDNALCFCDFVQSSMAQLSRGLSCDDLIEYFKELRIDSKYRVSKKEDTNVFLYTFHGAKGLEFDEVFCINVNEGFVPSPKNETNLEEERRIFYVAITRAKFSLRVCCIKNRGGKNYQPSRFIDEMKN